MCNCHYYYLKLFSSCIFISLVAIMAFIGCIGLFLFFTSTLSLDLMSPVPSTPSVVDDIVNTSVSIAAGLSTINMTSAPSTPTTPDRTESKIIIHHGIPSNLGQQSSTSKSNVTEPGVQVTSTTSGVTARTTITGTALTTKKPKCTIGTASYEEFNLDRIPSTVKRCEMKQMVHSTSERRFGDSIRKVVCETCSYHAAKITNFMFPIKLPDMMKKATTVQVIPHGNCQDDRLPSNVFNSTWSKLQWLQIELEVPNECSSVYEAIGSWKTPKLKYLSFERPYFSISNQANVQRILRNSANITRLRINQGISNLHANIFDGVKFPKLTLADIRWKQNSRHVITQSMTFVSNAPKLRDLTLSVDLPLPDFLALTKRLKSLRNGQFGILLEPNAAQKYQLSLANTVAFDKIENLTLRISIERDDANTNPIVITGFQHLIPSLKCLTMMTKGVYAMNIEDESKSFCTKLHSILQNGQLMKCCRH